METRTIHLGGRKTPYTLKRTRRRTIGLSVGADGLTVAIPARARVSDAEAVLRAKADWIVDKLEAWAARRQPDLIGVDGEPIGYLGGVFPLQIETRARVRPRADLDPIAQVLRVRVPEAGTQAASATARRALIAWRKRRAAAVMTPKVKAYAAALDAPEPTVRFGHQKTRWGSCASDGTIRLNARLIAYPEGLIDYVCAHEACHLLEMNHGPGFYALMDRLMADHRARRKALKAAVPPGAGF